MHMPHLAGYWTVDDVHALPDDGNRYEVIDGELFVTPAPRWRHQEAGGELYSLIREYLKRERVGHAFVAPADVIFAATRLVQPDVFVTPLVNGRRPDIPVDALVWHPEGASTPQTIDLPAYFERVLDS